LRRRGSSRSSKATGIAFVLAERKDPRWPDRFAADLGPVDIPRGAAGVIAEEEAQQHNRAHGSGGAGYRIPIWPSRSTSWI
jgi:hypothetical protein